MGPVHFSGGQTEPTGGLDGGVWQVSTVQAQVPSGTGTQVGPARLPSSQTTVADFGMGPVHFSGGQTGSGGGLHLQVSQPLASLTLPYSQKMAHTGPQPVPPSPAGGGLHLQVS